MSRITALTVPKWGIAMEEGTLVNWLVNEGDALAEGTEVAELESSKIVNVLETHTPGTLRRVLAAVGDTLPVGGLLGVLADPAVTDAEINLFIAQFRGGAVPDAGGEPAARTQMPGSAAAPSPAKTPAAETTQAVIPPALTQGSDDSGVPATPHARRLAHSLGVNLNSVTGTGRGGRVSETDIEKAVVAAGGVMARAATPGAIAGTAQAEASAPEVVMEIPLTGMRETIARRLQEAKQTVPHYRLVADASVDDLLTLRGRLNASPPGARITVNDMLVKACALALMAVPECNIQFDGRVVRRFRNADIVVAVALEDGLITPVVRAANLKSIVKISEEIRDLTKRAKSGRLKNNEYSGGTLTISNLAMYGIRQFDAIINPPQAAIVAVGRAAQRVVVRASAPAVATILTLSLSCDHRVIDGALGARLIENIVRFIEAPAMLIE